MITEYLNFSDITVLVKNRLSIKFKWILPLLLLTPITLSIYKKFSTITQRKKLISYPLRDTNYRLFELQWSEVQKTHKAKLSAIFISVLDDMTRRRLAKVKEIEALLVLYRDYLAEKRRVRLIKALRDNGKRALRRNRRQLILIKSLYCDWLVETKKKREAAGRKIQKVVRNYLLRRMLDRALSAYEVWQAQTLANLELKHTLLRQQHCNLVQDIESAREKKLLAGPAYLILNNFSIGIQLAISNFSGVLEGLCPVTSKCHKNNQNFFFSKGVWHLTVSAVQPNLQRILKAGRGQCLPPILFNIVRWPNPDKCRLINFLLPDHMPPAIYEVIEVVYRGVKSYHVVPFNGRWDGGLLISTRQFRNTATPPPLLEERAPVLPFHLLQKFDQEDKANLG